MATLSVSGNAISQTSKYLYTLSGVNCIRISFISYGVMVNILQQHHKNVLEKHSQ